MKVAIVDVGCGNFGSVGIAFERLGAEVVKTHDAAMIAGADRVVLPGVGAAGHAMAQIDTYGLNGPLRDLTQPVLGICLGMQLLFERTQEDDATCLGIIAGEVRRLEPAPCFPIPHMGWSKLAVSDDSTGLRDGDYVYFAHSYTCADGAHVVATADHRGAIAAVVRKRNFTGVQFHPERSGAAGARLLEAFLAR